MSNITLPSWCEDLRPGQVDAVQSILEAFDSGDDVVFLEAPTGSGKTLIAELVRQYLGKRGIYLCSTLSLQQQYLRDYPSAALLMGRANYPTLDYSHLYGTTLNSVTCSDCVKKKNRQGQWECRWCDPVRQCPYEQAKVTALRSDQVCSNTYYYLHEVNNPGTLRGRGLVVIDECDTLESILMSYIEVGFSEGQLRHFSLPMPGKKTVESAWLEWACEAEEILKARASRIPSPTISSTTEEIKEYNRTARAHADMQRLVDVEFGLGSGGWVYTGYRDNHVQFRPVRVDRFAKKYLWDSGKRFLLMSATVISTTEMADSLGIEE